MFKENIDGKTNYCDHKTDNTSGVCDMCLGGIISISAQASNQEQKKLVDEYDRIGKYLELIDEEVGLSDYGTRRMRKLLSHYAQEVRKEVLGEIDKRLPLSFNLFAFSGEELNMMDGYNKCLADVNKIINSMK